MKLKDVGMLAGAALAVYMLLKYAGDEKRAAPEYWVTAQGNTGYPPEAKTGGEVWV